MSWLFSRALAVEYSQGTLSDGAACALWRSTLTRQPFSWRGKMTDRSPLSRSGMIYQLLTDARGEALLMLFLAGSRAKTSASPVAAQGLTASGRDSGERWRASFARYDQDTSSWKTPQLLRLGGSKSYSGTWPLSGTMRSGECWERPPLAPLTAESGFGSSRLVPTPTVEGNRNRKDLGPKSGDGLATFVRRFPTPHSPERPLCRPYLYLSPDWVEWLMGWPIGWTKRRCVLIPWGGWDKEPVARVLRARVPRFGDRLRCLGNGQVPQCSVAAWGLLDERLAARHTR